MHSPGRVKATIVAVGLLVVALPAVALVATLGCGCHTQAVISAVVLVVAGAAAIRGGRLAWRQHLAGPPGPAAGEG